MYCPKCSKQQLSDEVQFCSSCGLPLLNLKELVSTGRDIRLTSSKLSEAELSAREKGTRQGVALMLLSVILVPAYILLAALFPANDRLIESSVSDTPFEKISQALLLTIFMFGLARLLYARCCSGTTAIPPRCNGPSTCCSPCYGSESLSISGRASSAHCKLSQTFSQPFVKATIQFAAGAHSPATRSAK